MNAKHVENESHVDNESVKTWWMLMEWFLLVKRPIELRNMGCNVLWCLASWSLHDIAMKDVVLDLTILGETSFVRKTVYVFISAVSLWPNNFFSFLFFCFPDWNSDYLCKLCIVSTALRSIASVTTWTIWDYLGLVPTSESSHGSSSHMAENLGKIGLVPSRDHDFRKILLKTVHL